MRILSKIMRIIMVFLGKNSLRVLVFEHVFARLER